MEPLQYPIIMPIITHIINKILTQKFLLKSLQLQIQLQSFKLARHKINYLNQLIITLHCLLGKADKPVHQKNQNKNHNKH